MSTTCSPLPGAVLRVVEHALIELFCDPSARACCAPRGSLWSAAQALDASALVSHSWRPDAGRRYESLGAALERRVSERSAPPPRRARIAASARRAAGAVEALAAGASPPRRALDELAEATIALATVGVQTWEAERAAPRSRAARQLQTAAHGLAMHRQTAELLHAASGETRPVRSGRDGVGGRLRSHCRGDCRRSPWQ
jgi:hypothetical protein